MNGVSQRLFVLTVAKVQEKYILWGYYLFLWVVNSFERVCLNAYCPYLQQN